MDSLRKSLSVLVLITFTSLAYAAPQRLRSAIDDGQITRLRGNVPHLAQAQYDRGPVSPSLGIQGASIVFNRSAAQQADVDSLLRQLQDPSSPNYHKWLTPQQYADRFGMSQADINKVSVWLQSHGLHVDRVATSRNQIYFSGTAAQIQAALHTQLHQFVQNGEAHFANATEPALPAAIADSVLAVRNLNNYRPKPRALKVQKVSGAEPHFTNGSSAHFISPDDLAVIYDIKALYDSGITGGSAIAVVGQTQVDPADIAAFRSASGLPTNPFRPVLMPNTGTSAVSSDDVLEAELDVEWSGAIAKDATILFVYPGNAKNSDGTLSFNVIDAFSYVIDNNLAPVISISYGLCEASAGASGRNFFQAAATQAVMQGQTISSASGDDGATDCEDPNANSATQGLAVDLPSAIPEVTGVGGSEFSGDVTSGSTYWSATNSANSASALSYIPETTWNDTAQTLATGDGLSAGGGGASAFFAKPAWQAGVGVPNDGKRDVPDIALNASAHHDGYLACSSGSCVTGFVGSDNKILLVGGTSVGAPVFAGIVSLINQAAQTNGQGNVNAQLYPLASSNPSAFHDITTGDNKIPCTSGSTGCSTANSHLVAASRVGWAGAVGSFLLISLVSIFAPTRRHRWLAVSGPILILCLAVGIGCGGGSSGSTTPSTPVTPPATAVSIGYSAGAGYDLATGLGSIDAATLVNNWPGVPAAPSFTVSESPASLTAVANQPTVSSLVVSSTTGFSGAVALSCASVPANPQVICSVTPSTITLSSGTTTASATLTVKAPAGSYSILVKATHQTTFQFGHINLTSM
jgi:subtilase family serine protease